MMATETKAEVRAPAKVAERPSVSLFSVPATAGRPKVVGLIEEFGEAEGLAKYYAITRLEGQFKHPATGETFTGRYFFDPVQEGPHYRPELTLATLPPDARKAAAEIIATPQVKES